MTKVAYLVSEYPAPSHTFIRREVAALREKGCKIATFSVRSTDPAGDGPLDRAERRTTTAILARPAAVFALTLLTEAASSPRKFFRTFALAQRHRVPGLRAAVWALFHLAEAIVLARLVRAGGHERIHCHFANSGATVGMLAASHLGVPWSMTLHGISETDYPAGALLADKVRRASFVACASWFMRAQAMRIVDPAHWDKLRIVRCAIDPTALPEPSASTDNGSVSLICVGRLSSEKGHAGLLGSLRAVLDNGHQTRLCIVGDGPLLASLRAQTAQLALDEFVTFAGRLDEQATLMAIAASDCLVLPSLMEGLPVVLMEAMALGKPVLTSWVAGVPELVEPGQNGLLFAPGDWTALADKLTLLVADPDLRVRLGAAAQQRIHPEFSVRHAVEPLIGLFASGRLGLPPAG